MMYWYECQKACLKLGSLYKERKYMNSVVSILNGLILSSATNKNCIRSEMCIQNRGELGTIGSGHKHSVC